MNILKEGITMGEPTPDNAPLADLLQTAQTVAPKEEDANVQGLVDSKPKFDF